MNLAIDPTALPEGRPATLTARISHADEPALLVAHVKLSLGPAQALRRLPRREAGPSGDEYAPDALEVYPVLAAGGEMTFPLEVVPLAGRDGELRLEVGAIALDRLEPGERTARGATEVALAEATARLVLPKTVTLAAAVKVAPAPFPSAEAFARARLGPEDVREAIYLGDPAIWVLETPRGSTLVAREGEVRRYGGQLGRLARELCRQGEVAVRTSPAATEPATAARLADLAAAWAAKGLIVAFLDGPRKFILREDPSGGHAAEPPPPEGDDRESMRSPELQQGCQIPCVECKILRPDRKGCPECGGTGEVFRPARMADRRLQHGFGAEARKRADAALARARAATGPRVREAWATARSVLRGALEASVIYAGPSWAAGWEGLEVPPEDPGAGEALSKAVQDRLRLAVLDAEARAAGGE